MHDAFEPVLFKKRVTYFTIKCGLHFPTAEDARHWAEQIANGSKQAQIFVRKSPVTKDWSAEVHL